MILVMVGKQGCIQTDLVLVRWLRRQEVPQLFLAWMSGTVTREDRSLKCGGRVGAEDGSNSKACRVT